MYYFPLVVLLLHLFNFQTFERVSFEMERRVNGGDQTIKSTASVYFNANGEMVTRYSPPMNVYVFNNLDGEISIYNERDNTVIQSVNYQAGSTNTNFYYFLQGETDDMGLKKLGFALSNTEVKDGLLITEWLAPMDVQSNFASVELVHKDDLPVFLGHKDAKGMYVKKAFYYDYELLNGYIMFPRTITEMEFAKKDSIVSKTSFTNFAFDGYVDPNIFNFKIPSNAKVIK